MSSKALTVVYGNSPNKMTRKLLDFMKPFDHLDKNASIALKPNLVVTKPSSSGATTTPGIAREIISYLQENGFKNIIIMESSWLGDDTKEAFRICGYEDISKDFNVPLVDLKKDRTRKIKCDDLTLEVCRKAVEVDFLINLPVLKAHCQTKLTCALKNLKGCIPDREKRKYHSLGLHRPIGLLNTVIKSHLIIVDGIMGDLNHEEGGNPVEMGRIIGATDPVMVDSYTAGLIGYSIDDIPYIGLAADLGVGELTDDNTIIHEINHDLKPVKNIKAQGRAEKLAKLIDAREACSPCFGGIIHALQRLKDKGLLDEIQNTICVGRGFRDKENNENCGAGFEDSCGENNRNRLSSKKKSEGCIGIGNCTSDMATSLPGCPPRTLDILEYLHKTKVH